MDDSRWFSSGEASFLPQPERSVNDPIAAQKTPITT
jgi:hypothetical protein